MKFIVNDFTNDINPGVKGDYGVTYSTSKVEVPPFGFGLPVIIIIFIM